MNSKRSRPDFDYRGRAAAVEAARLSVRDAFEAIADRRDPADPGRAPWREAVQRFNTAVERAYPPGFWEDVERLRSDDWSGLESAIGFLEADPFFFRSGYVKARLLKLVKRAPLTAAQARRLRQVVLAAIEGRDRREFRWFCRLAVRLDEPELRRQIEAWTLSDDPGLRRRAGWARDALIRATGGKRGWAPGSGSNASDARNGC